MKTYTYDIKTNKDQEMIDLSAYIRKAIQASGLVEGHVTCFCPHTTAGLTINENADPDVTFDMINALNKTFPVKGDYRHFEGNSHAHLKSSFMGVDQAVLVHQGQAVLGRWQSVYFCEFDGPRNRKLIIRTQGEYHG